MENVIVFDLGGTLMRYEGMPHSWISYYQAAFEAVRDRFNLPLGEEDITRSVHILREYNPRYKPREIEHSAEFLFGEATRHWNASLPLPEIINAFFAGIRLTAKLYGDTLPALAKLRELGWRTAALTNLPSAMPDRLFRADIPELLEWLDLYVSSESCGWRKPNPAGLRLIARHFGAEPSRLIFVGDEKLDIATAKNAGCRAIQICREPETEDFGADAAISGLDELFPLILPADSADGTGIAAGPRHVREPV